jgi:hypothetical protein
MQAFLRQGLRFRLLTKLASRATGRAVIPAKANQFR